MGEVHEVGVTTTDLSVRHDIFDLFFHDRGRGDRSWLSASRELGVVVLSKRCSKCNVKCGKDARVGWQRDRDC